jgi:hypothetical protein
VAAVLAVPWQGGAANESAGTVKAGFYEFPLDAAWRHVTPPEDKPDAKVDVTLSPSELTVLPRLIIQPAEEGAASAGAAVDKVADDAALAPLGKVTRDRPCAMPVGGYPAKGRLVVRTDDNGVSVTQFVLGFADAKSRVHVAAMLVPGDEPPIPDAFDSALRRLKIDGASGPAAEKQVVRGPEAAYHLVLPDGWKFQPSPDPAQPDVLAETGVDPAAPGTRPVILLHKKVTSGDKLDAIAAAAAKERGIKTGWLLPGTADAFRVARHDASKRQMEWRYHISQNRRTVLISVLVAAPSAVPEPPDAVKSILDSLIP